MIPYTCGSSGGPHMAPAIFRHPPSFATRLTPVGSAAFVDGSVTAAGPFPQDSLREAMARPAESARRPDSPRRASKT